MSRAGSGLAKKQTVKSGERKCCSRFDDDHSHQKDTKNTTVFSVVTIIVYTTNCTAVSPTTVCYCCCTLLCTVHQVFMKQDNTPQGVILLVVRNVCDILLMLCTFLSSRENCVVPLSSCTAVYYSYIPQYTEPYIYGINSSTAVTAVRYFECILLVDKNYRYSSSSENE